MPYGHGEQGARQQNNSHSHGRIGYIEGRPEVEVNEVSNVPQAYPINQVAGGTPKDEANGSPI